MFVLHIISRGFSPSFKKEEYISDMFLRAEAHLQLFLKIRFKKLFKTNANLLCHVPLMKYMCFISPYFELSVLEISELSIRAIN